MTAAAMPQVESVVVASAPTERFEVARQLMHRPAAVVSFGALVLILGCVVIAPLIQRHSPTSLDPVALLQAPSGTHWFGTDELGRDLFSRVLNGGRLTLVFVAVGTLISVILGALLGGLAGILGGFSDELMMRTVDGILAIPVILTALILVAAFGASTTSLPIILGLLHVPATARMMRAVILVELGNEYCLAAVASGASRWRVLRREVFPNTLPTLLAQASVNGASILLTEATLSFIGLGVQPPSATWGTLVEQGYSQIYTAPTYVIFPSVAIFLTILALNVFADQLQAGLDPEGRLA